MQTIRKAGPKTLVDVRLFDIFRGKSLGPGKVSYCYALEFRAPDRTLKDEEVNAADEAIRNTLKSKLKVEIREG